MHIIRIYKVIKFSLIKTPDLNIKTRQSTKHVRYLFMFAL